MTISAEHWEAAVEAGWRLDANFVDDPATNRDMVEALREEFGEDRVRVAVAFDHEAMLPFASEDDGLAVYVQDVNELLAELHEDLLNWDHGHELEVVQTY